MRSTDNRAKPRPAPPFLVVIGGSAGSIEALQRILARLPQDLNAAVLVVVHISAQAPSILDKILDRAGPLPASTAADGEPLQVGHVYVAPPDRHLIVQDGTMRVVYGPRQNRARPAVDPLFSSAAAFDGRVVAVVLSGMLDDGTMGALGIKEAGGTIIVQSPDDAQFPAMPSSVITYIGANYVLPAPEIAHIIAAIVSRATPVDTEPAAPRLSREGEETLVPPEGDQQRRSIDKLEVEMDTLHAYDDPFALICPECGGAMVAEPSPRVLRYRCFLGHSFTAVTLWHSQIEAAESHLWRTLRVFEETAYFGHKMIDNAREDAFEGADAQVNGLKSQVARVEQRIDTIRDILGAASATAQQVARRSATHTDEEPA